MVRNFPNIQHLQFTDLGETHSDCININHGSSLSSFPQAVHLYICMRKPTKDNYRVASGMCPES